MKVYIKESQLNIIKEFENNKILHEDFESKVREYLLELWTNPCKPKYDEFFSRNDIPERELLNKMVDLGLIKKVDNITEPEDADGKKHSVHTRKYIFSGSNFDPKTFSKKNINKDSFSGKEFADKIDKLYDSFFQNGERKLNECDCGGCAMAGGMTEPVGATTNSSVLGDDGWNHIDATRDGKTGLTKSVMRRGIYDGNKKKSKKKNNKEGFYDAALSRPTGKIAINNKK